MPALAEVLRIISARLGAAGIIDSGTDAELILAHVYATSRGDILAAALRGDDFDAAHSEQLAELVRRREAREPLQHLTGLAPFRHLMLRVGPGVFVPRPETEIVAQLAIDSLATWPHPEPIAVDLGTGSGAIALAMASEVPHARVFAAEKSPDAYGWARTNILESGVTNLVLEQVDLQDAFPELMGQVSVLVSNPPYVPDDAVPNDPEVRRFDPPQALYGGADGLDVIRTLARVGLRLVHPGGVIVLEHGEWQGAAVRGILAEHGWRAAATHPDLTHRDRATTAHRE